MPQGLDPSSVNAPQGDPTLGDYLFGQKRFQATAPSINQQQTTTGFDKAAFYNDLGTSAQRSADIYGQQQGLAGALAARAAGQGPSLAEMQMNQSLAQNQKAAAGALAGVRGLNPAMAQRLLLNQQAALSGQAANQGAMLRAQEQLAAQQALGAQLSSMRGAEGQMYGQAGQLGLGQSKLGVETEEARKNRELEIAKANQAAEENRQRTQIAANQAYAADNGMIGDIGSGVIEAGKAAAKFFADGGKVNEEHLTKLDNTKNDVIPAMLSEGEVVIPRSIMHSKDPVKAAGKFVQALMAKKSPVAAKHAALGGVAKFKHAKELGKRAAELKKSK
jgi:hypothetical protein